MDVIISISLALGFGAVCGAAILWLIEDRRGIHGRNPYGSWLSRECWIRPRGRETWRKHVIVAVSHKGAVCVREITRRNDTGYWIKKENVPIRLRFSLGSDEK